jgi:uncharacterized protein YjiS (DUF1127 family)
MRAPDHNTRERRSAANLLERPWLHTSGLTFQAELAHAEDLAALIVEAGAKVARFFRICLVAPMALSRKRRKLYDELMALDDHILDDIGIKRSEIPWVVEQTCRRPMSLRELRSRKMTVHHIPGKETREGDDHPAKDTVPPLAA